MWLESTLGPLSPILFGLSMKSLVLSDLSTEVLHPEAESLVPSGPKAESLVPSRPKAKSLVPSGLKAKSLVLSGQKWPEV